MRCVSARFNFSFIPPFLLFKSADKKPESSQKSSQYVQHPLKLLGTTFSPLFPPKKETELQSKPERTIPTYHLFSPTFYHTPPFILCFATWFWLSSNFRLTPPNSSQNQVVSCLQTKHCIFCPNEFFFLLASHFIDYSRPYRLGYKEVAWLAGFEPPPFSYGADHSRLTFRMSSTEVRFSTFQLLSLILKMMPTSSWFPLNRCKKQKPKQYRENQPIFSTYKRSFDPP